MEVVVYLLTANPDSPRTQRVRGLFDHPTFSVEIVTIEASGSGSSDTNRINWCLSHAKQDHPQSPIIIIKDTSVSNANPDGIADIVSSALSSGNWDICYLCRWQDRCDLLTEKRSIDNRTTLIARTQYPQGFQAVLITPKGRDLLLNLKPVKSITSEIESQVQSGKIHAICVIPSLVSFDQTAISSNSEYYRLQECRTPATPLVPGAHPISSDTGVSNYTIWLIIFIIIIVLFVLAGSYYRRKCLA